MIVLVGFNCISLMGSGHVVDQIYAGDGSRASVQFPSNGTVYSQVCGRIKGYQEDLTSAVDQVHQGSAAKNINSYYVDGVSLTHMDLFESISGHYGSPP